MSKRKIRRLLRKAGFLCVILILVLVMLYSGLQIVESTVLYREEESDIGVVSKTITRGEVDYFPRQDITVILVMGIDQSGPVESSESYNNKGAADLVMLLIFDETNEECSVLQLNRDTMVEMPVLGVGGRRAGTQYGQLALAHTYGDGLEDSCENTRETVSDLLYGIRIDYYVSMNMDAIAILNDAVGGVTVNIADDFSMIDPALTMGEVKLQGDQALTYVRTRKDVGDQLNITRITRQREYVEQFVAAFQEKQNANSNFMISTYERVAKYLVSDCSTSTIQNMIRNYAGYEVARVVTPEGENVLGEQYYEFYVDEEKLDSLILELFYAPKN